MSGYSLPQTIRQQVKQRANYRCEYCHTSEWLSGIACEIDHIIPRVAGGTDDIENLCLACSACNSYKGTRTEGIDPDSKDVTPLFNPRKQTWHNHFAWVDDGRIINGITSCGRATVNLLQVNHELIQVARTIWISVGLHPEP